MDSALVSYLERDSSFKKIFFNENGEWVFRKLPGYTIVKTIDEVLGKPVLKKEVKENPKAETAKTKIENIETGFSFKKGKNKNA